MIAVKFLSNVEAIGDVALLAVEALLFGLAEVRHLDLHAAFA